MRKQLLSVIVLLLLAMFTGAAFADETVTVFSQPGLVEVTLDLKSGDTVQQDTDSSDGIARLTVSRAGCADITVSVAYADLDGDGSLNALSENELALIETDLRQGYPSGTISRLTTSSGTLYFFTDAGEYDLHDIFTLFNGYYIELIQYHDDFSPLTDADQAFLTEVFQGIWTK